MEAAAAAFTAAVTAATMRTVEVQGQERIDVIQRYLLNPNMDDADLYYNGLSESDVASFRLAQLMTQQQQQQKQQQEEANEIFSPYSLLMREKASCLSLPNHDIPKSKTSPKRNPLFKKANGKVSEEKSPSSSPSTIVEKPKGGDRVTFKFMGNPLLSFQSSDIMTLKPRRKRAVTNNIKEQKEESGAKKRLKKEQVIPCFIELPYEIPARLKTHMNNKDAVLVIRKRLYETDVKPSHGRLSMPPKKLLNTKFLSDEEDGILSNGDRHLEIRLIEPSGKECKITLARWKMSSSYTYNLLKPWNEVVTRNELREGTIVEIYAFRERTQLYFALLKVWHSDPN